jgi:hypothetical protein
MFQVMTRDEIRLVAFVLLALCGGAAVQWWRGGAAEMSVAPAAVVENKKARPKPPYVFKSRAQTQAVKESLEGDREQR